MKALYRTVILIFGSICLLSCIDTIDTNEASEIETVIKACLDNADTKLSIKKQGSVYKTTWDETDSLCIFADGADDFCAFVLQSGVGQGTATFKGKACGEMFEAIYPFSIVERKEEDGSVICTFPEIQQYVSDGSLGNSFPMYACGNKDGLNFRNLAAVLGIPATGIANIKSITFTPNNGVSIAGKAVISSLDDDAPSLSVCEGGSSSITLECIGSKLNEKPTYFYICIPAGEYKEGFTLTFDTFDETFVREYHGDYSFERSQIRFTETIEVEGDPVDDLSLIKQPNLILYRSSTKNKLQLNNANPFNATVVSHRYSNNQGIIVLDKAPTAINGEIFIPSHARAVTEIHLPDNIEEFNSTFLNFSISDFKFPANTKTIYNSFNGCKYLKEIVLPEGLLNLAGYNFEECTELQYVTIPSSLKTIAPYIFLGCDKIQKFKGSNNLISEDGLYLFENTVYGFEQHSGTISKVAYTNLERIRVPDNAVYVQHYSFSACKGVKEIDLNNIVLFSPSAMGDYGDARNIEAIYGKYCTDDHKSLICNGLISFTITNDISEVVIPEGVTTIGTEIFSNPKSVKKVFVPEGVINTQMYAFTNCPNLQEIHLPSTMEELAINPFDGIADGKVSSYTDIYLKAKNPPRIELDFYYDYSNLTFYVPDESLNLYKSHSDWVGLKDRIFAYDYD